MKGQYEVLKGALRVIALALLLFTIHASRTPGPLQGLIGAGTVFGAQPTVRTEAKDTNKNGKPDEYRIYEGGTLIRIERDLNEDNHREVTVFVEGNRAVRSEVDRNGDGKADLVRRYSPQGLPDWEEGDLDFDDRMDYWAWYRQGLKVMAAQDRRRDGEPDAWFFYDGSLMKVVGGAIDEDGNGRYEKLWGAVPYAFPKEEGQEESRS